MQGTACRLGPAAQSYLSCRALTELCRVLHASRALRHGLPLPLHVGLPHASLIELVPPGRALVLPAIAPLRLSLPVATLLLPLAVPLLAAVAALRLPIPLLAPVAALRLPIPLLRLLAIPLLLAIASLGSPIAALQHRQHQRWAARQACCCHTHTAGQNAIACQSHGQGHLQGGCRQGQPQGLMTTAASMSSKQTGIYDKVCPYVEQAN